MATNSLRLQLAPYSPFVCFRCSLSLRQPVKTRRWLHTNPSWRAQTRPKSSTPAIEQPSTLAILEQRGYINQIAGTRDELDTLMKRRRVGAYVGIDPTASSMHVGHLIPFMALFWMHLYGHPSVTLLGGATAGVGDPTGRSTARIQQSRDIRLANTEAIHSQLDKLWRNVAALSKKHHVRPDTALDPGKILNNDTWLKDLCIMDVLSTIGSGLRLGSLLGRDTVKARMESSDGMSFSEFCYPVLQAWDWWHMFQTEDIQLQIGGADQYGNILSGADAIKYATKALVRERGSPQDKADPLSAPYGFTVPLLTTPAGEKFGKSAGNAVWLDKEQTSVFDLYGFFVSQPDADVERLLKLFTFLPMQSIKSLIVEHTKAPEKRAAQHVLATEFVSLVHGLEEAESARKQHLAMFSRTSPQPGDSSVFGVADVVLPLSLVLDKPFSSVFWSAELVNSKSEAVRLIKNKGAYVFSSSEAAMTDAEKEAALSSEGTFGAEMLSTQVESPNESLGSRHLLHPPNSVDKFVLLRSGKRRHKVVKVVSDKEFERLGLQAPGWKENAT